MDLSTAVDGLGRELVALLDTGDERAAALVERLSASLDSAIRLTLLEALSAAADEITRDLAPGSVELRLRGREPSFVVTAPPGEPAPAEPEAGSSASGEAVAPVSEGDPSDTGATTRINLRLPESLKASVEEAAAMQGRSVNAWLVRAASAALQKPAGTTDSAPRSAQRYTGWVR